MAGATWYVDDDALNDPGPNDAAVSDPQEDGSHNHPFDHPQEAIDAAADGDMVLVEPGDYDVSLPVNFNGKAVTVESVSGPDVTRIQMTGNPEYPDRKSMIKACHEVMGGNITHVRNTVYEEFRRTEGLSMPKARTSVPIERDLISPDIFLNEIDLVKQVRDFLNNTVKDSYIEDDKLRRRLEISIPRWKEICQLPIFAERTG